MSTNATDEMEDGVMDDAEQRYAELTIGDDEFVIYDRENHQAWIQSATSLTVADLR